MTAEKTGSVSDEAPVAAAFGEPGFRPELAPETLEHNGVWYDRRDTVDALVGLLGDARKRAEHLEAVIKDYRLKDLESNSTPPPQVAAHPTPDTGRAEGWQPIETAPKDGTWILSPYPLFRPGNHTNVPDIHEVIRIQWNGVGWDNGGWMLHNVPTHWQPLPTFTTRPNTPTTPDIRSLSPVDTGGATKSAEPTRLDPLGEGERLDTAPGSAGTPVDTGEMERMREALQEAIDVFDGMNDDEINEELLPRLRAALSHKGSGK